MQTIAVFIIIAIAAAYCIVKAAKALRSKDPCEGCSRNCSCPCDSKAEKESKE